MLHLQRAVKINWSRTNKLPTFQVFGCADEIHLVVLGRKKKNTISLYYLKDVDLIGVT